VVTRLGHFKVDAHDIPGGYLLVASGELDYGVAERFDQAFAAIGARSGDRVVLDLQDVRLIDSSGIASIVAINTRANFERFDFIIVRPQPSVMRIFEITTIDRWLTIVDEYDPAVGSEQMGADLDELSRRLERSQATLRSRRPVASPPDHDASA
jgi:anti-sigma B factor antagonist